MIVAMIVTERAGRSPGWLLGTVLCLAGCPLSVNGNGEGGVPVTPVENRGTGYLADGADPFPRDVASVEAGDAGPWMLGEGGLPLTDDRFGQIYAVLYNDGMGNTSSYLDVKFRYMPFENTACEQYTLGVWTYSDCALDSGGMEPETPPFPNAGTVRLTGTGDPITLTPNDEGAYEYWYQQGTAFTPGRTILVTASGDTVPAFTHMMRTTRSITSQTVTGLDQSVIVRTQPITVSWLPTSVELVTVDVRQSYQEAGVQRAVQLGARVEGDTGRLEVPASILARLRPGEPVEITVTPFVRDTFNAGSWPVTATFTGLGTRQTFSVR